ncbi:MAG TPA: cob(I)yrinic acid a,c-diamide adenosyltransferase [Lachnospiraceae bacterium]|jgi:ATP:corrinoid adenosyltransferase|nr:cob(I)yrinic acid a,c-diamide adenosyltransferase [Lachnospiraceae bacterium]
MRKGNIYMYYGRGKGKTTLAIGQGMRAVSEGLSVVMVQFLDYNNNKEYSTLKRMEPEFRAFRFEKRRESLEKADENEIRNEINLAFNFSKKIMETGESEMLILDGVIDAVKSGLIDEAELFEVLEKRSSYMDIIITGSERSSLLAECADYIYSINIEKTPTED